MTEKINQLKKELQENRKLNAELLAENKRSKSKVALQNKLIKQQKEVVESLDAIIAERGRGRILKKSELLKMKLWIINSCLIEISKKLPQ